MATSRPSRHPRQAAEPRPPEPAEPRQPRAPAALVAVRRIFVAEGADYFLLLGTTVFLVIFGLVMVLSSSSVESYVDDQDFFRAFARQGLFAVIGIPLMLIASRMPTTFWRRWAWPALFLAVGLQLLVFVPGIGLEYGNNNNWINLGAFTLQPSEILKVALVMWLATVLSDKQDLLTEWREAAVPIAPVALGSIGLVLLGNDLGTAIILLALVLGALFFAGARLRHLGLAVAGLGIVGAFFSTLSDSRMNRISAWLSGCMNEDDYRRDCWQTVHGWYALADGGLFGVGLGNSKAKWSWLPEADNDFIFAIIGEELGLVGAVVALLLFVVLAIAFVRIIRAARDPFARIAASAVMVWVIAQAFVNIAVVLGILPVLGVPLPLISAGGSALVTTLFAIGIVLSFARNGARTPR